MLLEDNTHHLGGTAPTAHPISFMTFSDGSRRSTRSATSELPLIASLSGPLQATHSSLPKPPSGGYSISESV